MFTDVTVAPKDLNPQVGRFATEFGQKPFQDRRQEPQLVVVSVRLFIVAFSEALHHVIGQPGRVIQHGPTALGDGFLGQEHPAHIGMVNQAIGHLIRLFFARECPHGASILGIGQRPLIGQFRWPDTLNGSADPGSVHEGEHAVQPFVLGPDQVTGGPVEIEHAGGRGLDAHFLFQTATDHRVTCTQATLFVGQELGHDKQADTPGALGSVRQTSEDNVDNVLGQVVIAGGNENLGARQAIAAVGLWFGLGFHLAQIGAALGFGQAHGAGPAAFGQRCKVGLLLFVGTVQKNGIHGAEGQAGVHGEGPVGGAHHFLLQQSHGRRQALAAIFLRCRQSLPATHGVLLVGFAITGGCRDLTVLEFAAFLVAGEIEWAQYFLTEFCAFAENCIHDIRCGVFTAGKGSVMARVVEHFVQQKFHVAQGRLVNRHSGILCLFLGISGGQSLPITRCFTPIAAHCH